MAGKVLLVQVFPPTTSEGTSQGRFVLVLSPNLRVNISLVDTLGHTIRILTNYLYKSVKDLHYIKLNLKALLPSKKS